jgi:regulator of sigma E protease
MIITILVFAVILTILVMIHELGHFTVARMIGVHVEEFGLGLPPRIIGRKIKQTIYSLNWLPIGGFVKLAGEDDDSEEHPKSKNNQNYFWGRSKTERALILVAGVTMNFILAVAITAGLLVDGVNEPSGHVKIESVSKDSPADLAGLKINDIVRSVKGVTPDGRSVGPQLVKVPADMITVTKQLSGTPVDFEILRDGTPFTLKITPRINPPKGEGAIGVGITDLEIKKYSPVEAPFAAVRINIERAGMMVTGIGDTLWGLVTLKKTSPDVAGPIGIAQVTGQAVKFGFRAVLEFMSILSLNLAVLNILPIPALDGGRLAFVFIEKILGRRVKPAFEKQTHQIGMIILMILVLLVSINDIMRLSRGG